jgi:hypothetical protein
MAHTTANFRHENGKLTATQRLALKSTFGGKSEMVCGGRNVRFWPKADILNRIHLT